jgi:hypothetical protein
MTHKRRLTSTALVGLIAVLVVAAAMTGPAAAVSAFTFSADNADNAVYTNHSVSIDSDAESGDVKHIEVRYTESDITDVTAEDVAVTAGGSSQTVESVSSANNGTTLNVTLSSAYTLSSSASDVFEVNTTNDTVQNPMDAGDYTVEMALLDSSGADITSLSGTFTVTQGDTPSVNETSSDFSSSAVIQNYNSDENTSVVLQTEGWSDSQELQIMDANGNTLATFSNVTTVTSAGSSTPGTYEFQLTQADFRSVPVSINENASFSAKVVNTSASTPANTFDSEIQNGDQVSQVAVTHDAINDSGVGPDVEYDAAGSGLIPATFTLGGDDYTVSDTRDINGSNTTVYVTFVDDDAATSFNEAGTLLTDASEMQDGNLMAGQSAHVSDEYIAVYKNEAGDLHPDGSSYAVYDTEADRLTIELGEQHENESTVEMDAENDAAPLRVRYGIADPSDLDADEDSMFSFGFILPLGAAGVARRRAAA